MKKIFTVVMFLSLFGTLGCSKSAVAKKTVQKVSGLLEEATTEIRSMEGYKVHQVEGLVNIAKVYEKVGLHDKAIELIPLAIKLMRDTQYDPEIEKSETFNSLITKALINLALADNELGNSREADTLLNEALNIAKSRKDDLERASELSKVAKAYTDIGMKDKSRQILSLFEETANAPISSGTYAKLCVMLEIAEIYNALGEKDKAWDELSRIVSWVESLDPDDFACNLVILGSRVFTTGAYSEFGPYDKALEFIKARAHFPDHLLNLADRDRKNGNSDREKARLDDALSIAESQKDNLLKAKYLYKVAIYYATTGRPAIAKKLRDRAEEAITNATEDDRENYIGDPNSFRAIFSAHLGEHDKAVELARTLEDVGSRGEMLTDIASIIIEKSKPN